MFYFYTLRDFAKTLQKVEEMSCLDARRNKDVYCCYIARSLEGQSLLYLQRPEGARRVMKELKKMVDQWPQGVPYGDEVNFLEEMVRAGLEVKLCGELLATITPQLKDFEFKTRALLLAKRLHK